MSIEFYPTHDVQTNLAQPPENVGTLMSSYEKRLEIIKTMTEIGLGFDQHMLEDFMSSGILKLTEGQLYLLTQGKWIHSGEPWEYPKWKEWRE